MAEIPITCIRIVRDATGHAAVTHIGSKLYGMIWSMRAAVSLAERGEHRFYLLDFVGLRVSLEIRAEPGMTPHLQGRKEGLWVDDLLQADQCPETGWRVVE